MEHLSHNELASRKCVLEAAQTAGGEGIHEAALSCPVGARGNGERFRVRAVEFALVLLGSLLINILVQFSAGAYETDLTGYPDEPSHYVTGLMLRDYVAAGLPQSPVDYARSFQAHYPRIGIGHWPPVFYIIEAGWMLVFSPGRVSVLLLMAVLTSLLAALVYWRTGLLLGRVAALASTGMLLMIWEVQRQTLLVMPEILVAIWALLAAIAFGRFIDTQDWRHSLWFGVFASLAILTKGNGWALALLPPSAILFSGKFKLIFHRALWIGAAVVAAVCVPWHVLTMALVRHVWLPANTRPNTLSAEYETARLFLMNVAGSTGAALCLAGFAVVIFGLVRRRFELPGQWASITALLLAVLVFHPLVPLPFELRKMLAAVPPFVMLAAAGVDALARAVRFIPLSRVVLFSAGMIAFSFHDLPAKYPAGFREAAIVAASQRLPLDVYLVSGSAGAEGAFIAEIAMHDRRPRRVVIRASKAFAESDSNMTRYRLLFDTTAAMQRELKRLSVGLIVVEDSPHANSIPHHSLLTRMLEELPREWAALPATESRDKLRRVRIFRRAASARVVE